MNKGRMKVKAWQLVIIFITGAFVLYMAISGFVVQPNVYMGNDFSLSEDGTELRFAAVVLSSMGYIRGYKDEGGGVKPHYLKFYSAWGGFNGSIGAKNEFVLKLLPDDTEVYFYRGDMGYKLVLEKDKESGEWHIVK